MDVTAANRRGGQGNGKSSAAITTFTPIGGSKVSFGSASSAGVTDREGRTCMTEGQGMSCEPLIDADRAAELLGVHPKTVKRMANGGLIPGMRIGKLWRFRESVLDSWMSSQLNSTSHPRPHVSEKGRK